MAKIRLDGLLGGLLGGLADQRQLREQRTREAEARADRDEARQQQRKAFRLQLEDRSRQRAQEDADQLNRPLDEARALVSTAMGQYENPEPFLRALDALGRKRVSPQAVPNVNLDPRGWEAATGETFTGPQPPRTSRVVQREPERTYRTPVAPDLSGFTLADLLPQAGRTKAQAEADRYRDKLAATSRTAEQRAMLSLANSLLRNDTSTQNAQLRAAAQMLHDGLYQGIYDSAEQGWPVVLKTLGLKPTTWQDAAGRFQSIIQSAIGAVPGFSGPNPAGSPTGSPAGVTPPAAPPAAPAAPSVPGFPAGTPSLTAAPAAADPTLGGAASPAPAGFPNPFRFVPVAGGGGAGLPREGTPEELFAAFPPPAEAGAGVVPVAGGNPEAMAPPLTGAWGGGRVQDAITGLVGQQFGTAPAAGPTGPAGLQDTILDLFRGAQAERPERPGPLPASAAATPPPAPGEMPASALPGAAPPVAPAPAPPVGPGKRPTKAQLGNALTEKRIANEDRRGRKYDQDYELGELRKQLLPKEAQILDARLAEYRDRPEREDAKRLAANEIAFLRLMADVDVPPAAQRAIRKSLGLAPAEPYQFKKRAQPLTMVDQARIQQIIAGFDPADQGKVAHALQVGQVATGVRRAAGGGAASDPRRKELLAERDDLRGERAGYLKHKYAEDFQDRVRSIDARLATIQRELGESPVGASGAADSGVRLSPRLSADVSAARQQGRREFGTAGAKTFDEVLAKVREANSGEADDVVLQRALFVWRKGMKGN